jgi:polysaccharide pyruvyl transferase WcaK-like protein
MWPRILRGLLAPVQWVCLREAEAYNLACNLLGSDRRLRLVPDMALQDDSADLEAGRRELARFGLESQPFVAMTVSNGDAPNYAGPPPVSGSLECLARVCAMLQEDGFRVFVWTHVESDGGTSGDENAMRDFARMAPSNVVISNDRYPPSLVRGILHSASAVVSQRLHPCIFAAQAGRPVVPLAALPKFHGVLSMLKIEDAILDGSKPDADALYRRVREVMADPRRFAEARDIARALGDRSRALFAELLRECWNTFPVSKGGRDGGSDSNRLRN